MESKYSVQLSKAPIKYIKRQEAKVQDRIITAINDIESNPYPENNRSIRQLSGKLKNYYRYRIGSIRIIYEIIEEELVVLIIEVGNRGDVYK